MRILFGLIVVVFLISSTALYIVFPPAKFPQDQVITIPEGTSVLTAANLLRDAGYIKSSTAFWFGVETLLGGRPIIAGDYTFSSSRDVFTIAYSLVNGIYGDTRIRVTIPEGSNRRQMAAIFSTALQNFDDDLFMTLTKNKEGYLFPDTYLFFPSVTTNQVIKKMEENFSKKIADFQEEIISSGKSQEEIIIMASIIAKEAYGKLDSPTISGILWKRIDQDLPLQVDAPLVYEKTLQSSAEISAAIRENSKYNTYKNKGLPPTPIGNPGTVAISAALNPKESNYLFYIHDKDGRVHYAQTFSQHKANIANHLR